MVNTGSQLTVYGSRLKRLKDHHENRKYEKEKGGQAFLIGVIGVWVYISPQRTQRL